MNLVALACVLFSVGLLGVLVRRDIIAVLASVEVMLGGAMVLFVGLGASARGTALSVEGIALMIIVVIAAEAAVGLALLFAVARSMHTTRVSDLTEVKG
jgi:NADH:ubiquinone oxidoreductase subunit K